MDTYSLCFLTDEPAPDVSQLYWDCNIADVLGISGDGGCTAFTADDYVYHGFDRRNVTSGRQREKGHGFIVGRFMVRETASIPVELAADADYIPNIVVDADGLVTTQEDARADGESWYSVYRDILDTTEASYATFARCRLH